MWTGRFFVRAIREAGFSPIVIFPTVENERIVNEDYALAKEYTDRYSPVYLDEGIGFDVLVSRLRERGTCAVVCGCELGVPLAERLAQALGLPGNDPGTTALRRDKGRMQAALQASGLRHIRSRVVTTPGEALEFAQDLGTVPVVLKPLSSSGSDGLHFCRDLMELESWTRTLLGRKNWSGDFNRELLVQEYIRGTEYILNCVSRDGAHVLTDMWVYHKVAVEGRGNCYDSITLVRTLDERGRNMVEYLFQALTALGFEHGPSHSELFWDDHGPVLVETGARPMGGYMNENILIEATGHYLADTALFSSIDAGKFQGLCEKAYAPARDLMEKYFITPKHGRLKSIPALPLLRNLPSVREICIREAIERYRTEETVDYFSSPGYALLCHEDSDVLMQDYRIIRDLEEKHPALLFEGGEDGPVPTGDKARPMVFDKSPTGYTYDGGGDVLDLETAFSSFADLIQTMHAGQSCRITGRGLRALGLSPDALTVALRLLGLAATDSGGERRAAFFRALPAKRTGISTRTPTMKNHKPIQATTKAVGAHSLRAPGRADAACGPEPWPA